MPKRNLIFVFNGGTMNGVFGAGVASALQEANIYHKIESVYGISAGAHNAAFFLTKDAPRGSTIYYEDLIEKKFIHKNKFGIFLKQLILNAFRKQKIENVIDIDYLINVEKTTKKLKVDLINDSEINFFIKVFNLKKNKAEYLKGVENTLKKIQASSAIIPFYPKIVKIGEKIYADNDSLSNKFDGYLIKQIKLYPDKTFILIFNKPINFRVYAKSIFSNFLWSILSALYLKKLSIIFNKNDILEYYKLKKILKSPNVLYIASDIDIHNLCDSKSELLNLYKHGIKKTEEFLLKNKINF